MDRFQAMAIFVRVVETGSFSAAARQLEIGQPAISKTISRLEKRLQVRLLTRSTQGFTLTEAGARFYERARSVLEAADEADLAARGAGTEMSGRLRVAAGTTFARLHVVPHLPRFLAEHPGLDIDLVLDDRVVDPIVEGIDLSLRVGALPDSSAVARKLATADRVVIASPAYVARAGEPSTPARVADYEALVYSRMTDVWSFSRAGGVTSVTARGRMRVSAAEGLRAAVLAGMGLTVASEWMFAPELATGAVRRLLTPWELPPVDLWAVFPAGHLASAKARRFASFVEAVMAEGAGGRAGGTPGT